MWQTKLGLQMGDSQLPRSPGLVFSIEVDMNRSRRRLLGSSSACMGPQESAASVGISLQLAACFFLCSLWVGRCSQALRWKRKATWPRRTGTWKPNSKRLAIGFCTALPLFVITWRRRLLVWLVAGDFNRVTQSQLFIFDYGHLNCEII